MASLLELQSLELDFHDRPVLKGVSLKVEKGQSHLIVGAEGSGKTALAHAVMGDPRCRILKGRILYEGEDIARLPPYERARKGIFLGFQKPPELPGVSLTSLVRAAMRAVPGREQGLSELRKTLREKTALFESGDRRLELIQLSCLSPRLTLWDGLDLESGNDPRAALDAVQRAAGAEGGSVVLTRSSALADYFSPQFVHILEGGRLAPAR